MKIKTIQENKSRDGIEKRRFECFISKAYEESLILHLRCFENGEKSFRKTLLELTSPTSFRQST